MSNSKSFLLFYFSKRNRLFGCPFKNDLTDEQWSSFKKHYDSFIHTIRVLADYDDEIASVVNIINETNSVSSDEEASEAFATKESGMQRILEAKEKYIDTFSKRCRIIPIPLFPSH